MTTRETALNPRDVAPEAFLAAARQVRRSLYWEKKDVASYVVVAKHLLDTALLNGKGSSEPAEFFRARALALSYDIASLTWPGWNEPEIVITPELQAVGLEAARLNLRLAHEADASADARSGAHFILGAQLLAAGEPSEAIRVWSASPDEQHCQPWILLAKVVQGGAADDLDRALSDLRAKGGEAEGTSKQVQTARSVFAPHQANPASDRS